MGKVVISEGRCKGCALCVEFCPKGSLEISSTTNESGYYIVSQKNLEACSGCTLCAVMCPDMALEVYKQCSEEVIQVEKNNIQR